MVVAAPFTGFSRDAIQFLADLALHNERAWFQPRKGDYERLLKEPLEALCLALAECFETRGLPLRSDPTHSPFRIYRDVRFSADKSPYKTHVSASFPWAGEAPAGEAPAGEAPAGEGGGVGGYFHFQPGEMIAGGGMWHPEPAQLAAWRRAVSDDLPKVREALESPEFAGTFGEVSGSRLKRIPTGFRPDHPGAELLKLKDVTFGRRLSDDDILSPDLPEILTDTFLAAVPVLRLLARLAPEGRAGWLRGG
jgi:uncharacterized protein (TIGR02453 family)